MWSVFENEYRTKVGDQYQWVKSLEFFYGDLSLAGIDFKTDWRFCEVPGKRNQVKFLGTVETDFPIKYPLILDNGTILEDVYYNRLTLENESDN